MSSQKIDSWKNYEERVKKRTGSRSKHLDPDVINTDPAIVHQNEGMDHSEFGIAIRDAIEKESQFAVALRKSDYAITHCLTQPSILYFCGFNTR